MSEPKKGRLFIISAPSGAGKTSVARSVVESAANVRLSVSHTTRDIRKGELSGIDYHFIDPETFNRMIAENRFLEYATVFDHRYGTSLDTVEQDLNQGIHVLLDIDWQGARKVRARLPSTTSIFILPPSIEVLRQRLQDRGRDDVTTIERRMEDARREVSHFNEYDVVLVNDDFDETVHKLRKIMDDVELSSDAIPAGFLDPET